MDEETVDLTIEDLAEAADVPVRTVRYYISEGLLPGPGARGKGASYGEEHLLRLRLIRRLVEQRLPLATIRDQMAALSLPELRSLLADVERRGERLERAASSLSPKQYLAGLLENARIARETPRAPSPPASAPPSQPGAGPPLQQRRSGEPPSERWQRWELAPGVELHVRADLLKQHRRLIARLLAASGPSNEADPSASNRSNQ